MGLEKTFTPERLVVGVLSSDETAEHAALDAMVELYGALCFRSEREPFLWTMYYCPEMGEHILRSYWSFERLVDPSTLAAIKHTTDTIEQKLAENGSRKVNLDPGLLGTARFCLATTKDRSHRIPLAGGIYAELTLLFKHGEFKALPWTYPDWASEPVRRMLGELRGVLLTDLRRQHFL
ncbi:MAG TPA: DUF4416 domain-containing protein [Spirochaetaceae bacterium]|nr:DUF4416 domain-containing protein [Spirochaetaceae bacterium]